MSKERLKPFVNDPMLWEAFQEYIEDKINTAQRTLVNSTGVEVLYREQGKIHALSKLLSLRDDVNGPDYTKQGKLL